MPVGKGMAGADFEVFLEGPRFGAIGKPNDGDRFPGAKLGGKWRGARVVAFETFPEIARDTDIALAWMTDALDEIDVHASPPPGTKCG